MNESSGTSACRCSDEFEKTMAENPQCLHVVMIRLITAYEHHLDTLDCDEPKFFDCDDTIESHRHADGFGSADVLNWWTTNQITLYDTSKNPATYFYSFLFKGG